ELLWLIKAGKLADHAINISTPRLHSLYQSGLTEYLRTLRDVRRLLAVLPFHFRLFATPRDDTDTPTIQTKASAALVVDTVDLIGLEALRLFEPDVFKRISSYSSYLTVPVDVGTSMFAKPEVV